ncbi:unnamed protein product [Amoebophrya sp. A120]|nr:unnamed protein product [Amoebophrya sp. A120]|eukprot:GSA120T00003882001.1
MSNLNANASEFVPGTSAGTASRGPPANANAAGTTFYINPGAAATGAAGGQAAALAAPQGLIPLGSANPSPVRGPVQLNMTQLTNVSNAVAGQQQQQQAVQGLRVEDNKIYLPPERLKDLNGEQLKLLMSGLNRGNDTSHISSGQHFGAGGQQLQGQNQVSLNQLTVAALQDPSFVEMYAKHVAQKADQQGQIAGSRTASGVAGAALSGSSQLINAGGVNLSVQQLQHMINSGQQVQIIPASSSSPAPQPQEQNRSKMQMELQKQIWKQLADQGVTAAEGQAERQTPKTLLVPMPKDALPQNVQYIVTRTSDTPGGASSGAAALASSGQTSYTSSGHHHGAGAQFNPQNNNNGGLQHFGGKNSQYSKNNTSTSNVGNNSRGAVIPPESLLLQQPQRNSNASNSGGPQAGMNLNNQQQRANNFQQPGRPIVRVGADKPPRAPGSGQQSSNSWEDDATGYENKGLRYKGGYSHDMSQGSKRGAPAARHPYIVRVPSHGASAAPGLSISTENSNPAALSGNNSSTQGTPQQYPAGTGSKGVGKKGKSSGSDVGSAHSGRYHGADHAGYYGAYGQQGPHSGWSSGDGYDAKGSSKGNNAEKGGQQQHHMSNGYASGAYGTSAENSMKGAVAGGKNPQGYGGASAGAKGTKQTTTVFLESSGWVQQNQGGAYVPYGTNAGATKGSKAPGDSGYSQYGSKMPGAKGGYKEGKQDNSYGKGQHTKENNAQSAATPQAATTDDWLARRHAMPQDTAAVKKPLKKEKADSSEKTGEGTTAEKGPVDKESAASVSPGTEEKRQQALQEQLSAEITTTDIAALAPEQAAPTTTTAAATGEVHTSAKSSKESAGGKNVIVESGGTGGAQSDEGGSVKMNGWKQMEEQQSSVSEEDATGGDPTKLQAEDYYVPATNPFGAAAPAAENETEKKTGSSTLVLSRLAERKKLAEKEEKEKKEKQQAEQHWNQQWTEQQWNSWYGGQGYNGYYYNQGYGAAPAGAKGQYQQGKPAKGKGKEKGVPKAKPPAAPAGAASAAAAPVVETAKAKQASKRNWADDADVDDPSKLDELVDAEPDATTSTNTKADTTTAKPEKSASAKPPAAPSPTESTVHQAISTGTTKASKKGGQQNQQQASSTTSTTPVAADSGESSNTAAHKDKEHAANSKWASAGSKQHLHKGEHSGGAHHKGNYNKPSHPTPHQTSLLDFLPEQVKAVKPETPNAQKGNGKAPKTKKEKADAAKAQPGEKPLKIEDQDSFPSLGAATKETPKKEISGTTSEEKKATPAWGGKKNATLTSSSSSASSSTEALQQPTAVTVTAPQANNSSKRIPPPSAPKQPTTVVAAAAAAGPAPTVVATSSSTSRVLPPPPASAPPAENEQVAGNKMSYGAAVASSGSKSAEQQTVDLIPITTSKSVAEDPVIPAPLAAPRRVPPHQSESEPPSGDSHSTSGVANTVDHHTAKQDALVVPKPLRVELPSTENDLESATTAGALTTANNQQGMEVDTTASSTISTAGLATTSSMTPAAGHHLVPTNPELLSGKNAAASSLVGREQNKPAAPQAVGGFVVAKKATTEEEKTEKVVEDEWVTVDTKAKKGKTKNKTTTPNQLQTESLVSSPAAATTPKQVLAQQSVAAPAVTRSTAVSTSATTGASSSPSPRHAFAPAGRVAGEIKPATSSKASAEVEAVVPAAQNKENSASKEEGQPAAASWASRLSQNKKAEQSPSVTTMNTDATPVTTTTATANFVAPAPVSKLSGAVRAPWAPKVAEATKPIVSAVSASAGSSSQQHQTSGPSTPPNEATKPVQAATPLATKVDPMLPSPVESIRTNPSSNIEVESSSVVAANKVGTGSEKIVVETGFTEKIGAVASTSTVATTSAGTSAATSVTGAATTVTDALSGAPATGSSKTSSTAEAAKPVLPASSAKTVTASPSPAPNAKLPSGQVIGGKSYAPWAKKEAIKVEPVKPVLPAPVPTTAGVNHVEEPAAIAAAGTSTAKAAASSTSSTSKPAEQAVAELLPIDDDTESRIQGVTLFEDDNSSSKNDGTSTVAEDYSVTNRDSHLEKKKRGSRRDSQRGRSRASSSTNIEAGAADKDGKFNTVPNSAAPTPSSSASSAGGRERGMSKKDEAAMLLQQKRLDEERKKEQERLRKLEEERVKALKPDNFPSLGGAKPVVATEKKPQGLWGQKKDWTRLDEDKAEREKQEAARKAEEEEKRRQEEEAKRLEEEKRLAEERRVKREEEERLRKEEEDRLAKEEFERLEREKAALKLKQEHEEKVRREKEEAERKRQEELRKQRELEEAERRKEAEKRRLEDEKLEAEALELKRLDEEREQRLRELELQREQERKAKEAELERKNREAQELLEKKQKEEADKLRLVEEEEEKYEQNKKRLKAVEKKLKKIEMNEKSENITAEMQQAIDGKDALLEETKVLEEQIVEHEKKFSKSPTIGITGLRSKPTVEGNREATYTRADILALRPAIGDMEDKSGAVLVPHARMPLNNNSGPMKNGSMNKQGGNNYENNRNSNHGKGGSNHPSNNNFRRNDSSSEALQDCWRPPAVQLKLGENSWALSNKKRKDQDTTAESDEDAEVHRKLKSLMNKLTDKNFDSIYAQISCLIKKQRHIEQLMKEVFDKATTQHFFLDMYTKLTVQLNEDLREKYVAGEIIFEEGEEPKNFRTILLNDCQETFGDSLVNSQEFSIEKIDVESDEYEAFVKKKNTVTGNVRFIAMLLKEKMLASKVFNHICEELMSPQPPKSPGDEKTSASAAGGGGHNELKLELLVILCEIVADSLIQSAAVCAFQRNSLFPELMDRSKDKKIKPRLRFMIQDCVEKMKNEWYFQATN